MDNTKELQMLFKIDDKPVTINEMETYFSQQVTDCINRTEKKNIPIMTPTIVLFSTFNIVLLVSTILALSIRPNDVWWVALGILALCITPAMVLMINGMCTDKSNFYTLIQQAKDSNNLYEKCTLLTKAYHKVSSLDEDILNGLDTALIQQFCEIKKIYDTQIVNLICDKHTNKISVSYVDTDGHIQTVAFATNKQYQNVNITDDMLICTEKEIIFEQMYPLN